MADILRYGARYGNYPSFTPCRIVWRNVKYQPVLQMSELPVRCYGTLRSSTALFR